MAALRPPPRRAPRAAAWLALAALALAAASAPHPAAGEVVMVYAITRHGARNVLPKNATLGEDESSGGPTLLPAGYDQSRATGEEPRAARRTARRVPARKPPLPHAQRTPITLRPRHPPIAPRRPARTRAAARPRPQALRSGSATSRAPPAPSTPPACQSLARRATACSGPPAPASPTTTRS
jgi:hypothetical protein